MGKWAHFSFAKQPLIAIGALALLLLAVPAKPDAVAADSVKLLVETRPAGAMIMVNQHRLGRTPCRVTIPQNAAGYTVIRVVPDSFIGQYVQTRIYSEREKLPDHLYFDLRVPPPDPAMDIYFN